MYRYHPWQNLFQRCQIQGGNVEIEAERIGEPPGNGCCCNIVNKGDDGAYIRIAQWHAMKPPERRSQ